MDNIITGFIGIVLFLLFVGGLAESIGKLPFIIIVAIIGSMALYDFWEHVKEERKRAKFLSLHEAMDEGAGDPKARLD